MILSHVFDYILVLCFVVKYLFLKMKSEGYERVLLHQIRLLMPFKRFVAAMPLSRANDEIIEERLNQIVFFLLNVSPAMWTNGTWGFQVKRVHRMMKNLKWRKYTLPLDTFSREQIGFKCIFFYCTHTFTQ